MRLPTVALLALCTHAWADGATFSSGPSRVTLVELYTSEGCSSCPPAERWLSSQTSSPRLWKQFVPIAFHVDYWNYLGWEDALSSSESTQRQRAYSRIWGDSTIYTPSVVADGEIWNSWWENAALPESRAGHAGLLIASRVENGWRVDYQSREKLHVWKAHVALLGFDIKSAVKAGENGGRVLMHDFAVLAKGASTMEEGAEGFTAIVTLGKPSVDASRHGLAVWVTRGEVPAPVQAAGGYLPAE